MVALTRGVASAAFPLDRPFAIIAPYRCQKTAYGQGERNACAKFSVRGHEWQPFGVRPWINQLAQWLLGDM